MRTIVLAAIAAFVPAALAAGPVRIIDLDRPGAFAALAKENPAHHRRALEMIRIAENSPCKLVPKLYETAFEPDELSCAPTLLMTSLPPKRRVAFTIDDTRYLMVVTVVVDARAMNVK